MKKRSQDISGSLNTGNLAPIVLFVYNRPWHTEQTLNALIQNELADQSVLYIYSDGPKENASEEQVKKINEVRELIRSRQWCKEIHIVESDKNKGLADSIILGVTEIVNKCLKIIVLEDDIVTSPGFLKYMNDALDVYCGEEKVYHVSGYMYPLQLNMPETIFLNVVTPWGWGTWKEKWKYFNNDAIDLKEKLFAAEFYKPEDYNCGYGTEFYEQLQNNINLRLKTWAVKWHTTIYLKQGHCLHPGISLVQNIGLDSSGTHHVQNDSKTFAILKMAPKVTVLPIPLEQDQQVLKGFHQYYLLNHPPTTKVKSVKALLNNLITTLHHLLARLK